MNLNLKDLEKQFHADGYRLGMNAVKNNTNINDLHNAIRNMHKIIDEMIDSFSAYATAHNLGPVCKKGCSWCCHQPVYALSYELDYLNSWITENLDPTIVKQISNKAFQKNEKIKALNSEDLANSKHPCPLLAENACIAYEVRPVACRIYLSAKLESCLDFFHNPEDNTKYPALLSLPMRMGRMINEGFKAALKASGYEVTEFRIEEKVGQMDDKSKI